MEQRIIPHFAARGQWRPAQALLAFQGTGWAYLYGLIDVSNIFCLHIRVLLPTANELWKSSQESFYSDPTHVDKLPRDQGCRDIQL